MITALVTFVSLYAANVAVSIVAALWIEKRVRAHDPDFLIPRRVLVGDAFTHPWVFLVWVWTFIHGYVAGRWGGQ